VYFKADWRDAFDSARTTSGPFRLAGGGSAAVPLMRRSALARHHTTADYTAVELPYVGDELALLVVMPTDLAAFEATMTGASLAAIAASLTENEVDLTLPKWTRTTKLSLKALLTDMGMGELFSSADLSGIDGTRQLFVQSVVHQAVIEVTEQGTVAAAATGIGVGIVSVPVIVPITIDGPFFYALRDVATGAVLFLGRVVDPRPQTSGALPQ
jgi:serpin B